MKRTSGWLILWANVVVAVVVVAVLIRPAASVDDDLVVRRSSGATKAVERLEQALQTNAPESTSVNPFVTPVIKASAPEQSGSGIKMVGWALLNGADYALIDTASGEQYVQAGDVVSGWRVTKVTSKSLTLTRGEQNEEVRLK